MLSVIRSINVPVNKITIESENNMKKFKLILSAIVIILVILCLLIAHIYKASYIIEVTSYKKNDDVYISVRATGHDVYLLFLVLRSQYVNEVQIFYYELLAEEPMSVNNVEFTELLLDKDKCNQYIIISFRSNISEFVRDHFYEFNRARSGNQFYLMSNYLEQYLQRLKTEVKNDAASSVHIMRLSRPSENSVFQSKTLYPY